MTKAELEAAQVTVERLTWIYSIVGAVGAVVVLVGAAGLAYCALKLARTNDKLRPLAAAEADAAARSIAEANARAEEARQQTAVQAVRLADAEARIAEANQKAEEERLARVKIEEKLAPRHLAADQVRSIIAKLRVHAGQNVAFLPVSGDHEVQRITGELANAAAAAGWRVSLTGLYAVAGGRPVVGVVVSIAANADGATVNAARTLVEALSAERVAVVGPERYPPTEHVEEQQVVAVKVGSKP